MEFKNFKKEIDTEIADFFTHKTSLLQAKDKRIEQVLGHLGKILQNGKRIRPYLAFLSYKVHGGKEDRKVIKILTFLEIFHAFCLVHDDIMDRADKRHGVKTIHEFAKDQVYKNSFVNPKDFGNSQAILIGDFLFSWSWEILLTNKEFDQLTIERVKKIFLQTIDEAFIGQMIDLNISARDEVSEDEIMQKILLKTVGYSFIKPMTIGAFLATGTINSSFIERFGATLGVAFQIQDDLLDIKYESNKTKKSSFNDIAQHQHTFFTNYVFGHGTNQQKKTLKRLFGKKIKGKDKKVLRDLFLKSGAINYGQKEIHSNLTSAIKIVKEAKIDSKYKKLFLQLINYLNSRSS